MESHSSSAVNAWPASVQKDNTIEGDNHVCMLLLVVKLTRNVVDISLLISLI